MYVLAMGAVWIKERFFGKAHRPRPDVITTETGNVQVDKSATTVNVTEMPLSNLFRFGSTGKGTGKNTD